MVLLLYHENIVYKNDLIRGYAYRILLPSDHSTATSLRCLAPGVLMAYLMSLILPQGSMEKTLGVRIPRIPRRACLIMQRDVDMWPASNQFRTLNLSWFIGLPFFHMHYANKPLSIRDPKLPRERLWSNNLLVYPHPRFNERKIQRKGTTLLYHIMD